MILKYLLAINFLFLFSPSLLKASSFLHDICKDANDYVECTEANKTAVELLKKFSPKSNLYPQNKDKKNYSTEEQCWGKNNKWCIAEEGIDFLGLPKIVGWKYVKEIPDLTIWYFEREPRKVKVRGKYGRYLEVKSIKRQQFSAQSGTSATTYGTGRANCYESGYGTLNCNFVSPTIIPGSPGAPGGVGQIFFTNIIDCEDQTYQKIVKADLPIKYGRIRKKSKWISLSSKKANWFPKDISNRFCKDIYALENSNFEKYK